jgi:SAM-dependent methyltransferase
MAASQGRRRAASQGRGSAASQAHGSMAAHDGRLAPAPFVARFLPQPQALAARLEAGENPPTALDLACGAGRHTRLLAQRGYRVVALDGDVSGVADLAGDDAVEVVAADLENGRPFPLAGRRFGLVVVTNYLHRPVLDDIVAAVADGGRLLYETFSVDQPAFGRPTNPDFLLAHGELLEVVGGRLRVIAYEDVVDEPAAPHPPAARQRLCADRVGS